MANKHTKKALLMSALSILLCLSMLVGSTFAWFTDTASTGVNTIVAGNLDVKLNYWNGNAWEDAEASTATPFGADDLWEPGYTKVAYYQVENAGSLALKFRIGTNLISNVTGKTRDENKEIDLTKFIKFAVVKADQDKYENNRAQARTDALAADVNAFDAYSDDFELPTKGDTMTFAVIAFMPEATNNDANHNGTDIPKIEFGVKVSATQKKHESDSFGDDYDAGTTVSVPVSNASAFAPTVANLPDNGTIAITDPITVTNTTEGDLTNTGKTTNVDFGGTTATGSNGNIAFRARGNSVVNFTNGTVIADANTWSAISAAGNDTGKAVANISDMTLSNSKENGNCVRGFDNSEITIQDTTINSSVGGCVEMANGTLNIHSGTFTQTGKTVGAYDANSMNVAVHSGGTANIYGGTYSSETYGLYVFNSGGTMNVYGGSFKADKAVLIANQKAADAVADCVFNIYGGSFDGKIWMEAGAVLNIYEGTFTNTTLTLEQFSTYVAAGSTVTEANGVYTVTK